MAAGEVHWKLRGNAWCIVHVTSRLAECTRRNTQPTHRKQSEGNGNDFGDHLSLSFHNSALSVLIVTGKCFISGTVIFFFVKMVAVKGNEKITDFS